MSAKGAQIALLRVRLTESDELVKAKTLECEQLQKQCTRILQDHTDSSGIQSQAFDSLQVRILQLEKELQQRTTENENIAQEKNSLEKSFSDERQQLLEQLKGAEKRLNDERLQMHEQQQQAKHAKNLIHQLEQENFPRVIEKEKEKFNDFGLGEKSSSKGYRALNKDGSFNIEKTNITFLS